MRNTRLFLATALAAAGLGVSTGLAIAGDSTAHTVKPYQGIMLDVGSKQIGGYFTAADGRCKLNIIIADAYRDDGARASYSPVRVQMTVDVDKPALLDAADSKEVQFECLRDAQAMKATRLDRVALNTPAK
jgi:hypothetical protein